MVSASGRYQGRRCSSPSPRRTAHFPRLGDPLWGQVIAEKRATFSCVVDVERPLQRTALPNVYLRVSAPPAPIQRHSESAVRSGVACARMILKARKAACGRGAA